MSRPLRIVIADDAPDMLLFLEKALAGLGHKVVGKATTGKQLIEQCRSLQPELVITDIRMPDMDGIEAVEQTYRDGPVPVILVSGHVDADYLTRAQAKHILGFLVKPVREADLAPAIAVAMGRFEEFQALRRETADLQRALEDRKVIERAKGILMKRASLDEPEAFRRMRNLAMEQNRKLAEVAQMILTAEQMMQPSDA
jgi:response regulator NasT